MTTTGEDAGPAEGRIVGLVLTGSFPSGLPDPIANPFVWNDEEAQS